MCWKCKGEKVWPRVLMSTKYLLKLCSYWWSEIIWLHRDHRVRSVCLLKCSIQRLDHGIFVFKFRGTGCKDEKKTNLSYFSKLFISSPGPSVVPFLFDSLSPCVSSLPPACFLLRSPFPWLKNQWMKIQNGTRAWRRSQVVIDWHFPFASWCSSKGKP